MGKYSKPVVHREQHFGVTVPFYVNVYAGKGWRNKRKKITHTVGEPEADIDQSNYAARYNERLGSRRLYTIRVIPKLTPGAKTA